MTAWTTCPDCGVGPIGDHKKDCTRAGWNQTYRPKPKPRVRVKAPTRMFNSSVPDDAQPGDLVVGNRGAAAHVVQPPSQFGGLARVLCLEYAGNYYHGVVKPLPGRRVYDRS